MGFNIHSEIGSLEKVLIHTPLGEHGYLSKLNTQQWVDNSNKIDNPDYLLFDETVNNQLISKEHNILKGILEISIGSNNIITFYRLLVEILTNHEVKDNLLIKVLQCEKELYENDYSNQTILLKDLPTESLALSLITGRLDNGEKIFTFPLPNLIFTRDIGAVIGNIMVTTWSWHPSRRRESILSQYVFNHHPLFNGKKLYHFQKHNPGLSIEGGDILIFSEDIVCIGISQRTSLDAIKKLLPIIFDNGFDTVFAIELPQRREFMHLDTVFTRISKDECLVYPPLFTKSDDNQMVYRFEKNRDFENLNPKKDGLQKLFNENGYKMNFIPSGGNKRKNQDEELLTLGANVFALAPGKLVGYLQNTFTLKELELNGYSIYSPEIYEKRFDELNKSSEKYLIYLDETELSRGHGGIRCLTLPIERTNYVN